MKFNVCSFKMFLHGTSAGMYLAGTVVCTANYYRFNFRGHSGDGQMGESFKAYVQFDRGRITRVKCSCGQQNWCRHVLALCLARMNESAPLQLHPPISESLTNLDREQLQKLVQYILEKVPFDSVAAVQEVVCSLLDRGSEINQTPGAPGTFTVYILCIYTGGKWNCSMCYIRIYVCNPYVLHSKTPKI